MSGETVALAHWRALDRDGEDKCRLAKLDTGWMLVGHARFRDTEAGWAALDYVVRLGPDWRTLGCDVTGALGEDVVAWRLVHDGAGWQLNDAPQPGLDGCTDVDLGFTPATNLMPIRRLPEVGGLEAPVVHLTLPGPALRAVTQRYTRERGGYVHYANDVTGAEAHLAVDAAGFVTGWPGLWESAHEP